MFKHLDHGGLGTAVPGGASINDRGSLKPKFFSLLISRQVVGQF